MIKSLDELRAVKEKAVNDNNFDGHDKNGITVFVGMATCGIAAGATPVYDAFVSEVAKRGLTNVTVKQTGCVGVCQYEPVVEVVVPDEEKVTYVKMTAEKALRIIDEHIINKNVVTEYAIGANL